MEIVTAWRPRAELLPAFFAFDFEREDFATFVPDPGIADTVYFVATKAEGASDVGDAG